MVFGQRKDAPLARTRVKILILVPQETTFDVLHRALLDDPETTKRHIFFEEIRSAGGSLDRHRRSKDLPNRIEVGFEARTIPDLGFYGL